MEEDYKRNFLTYIPNINPPESYYCFDCKTFEGGNSTDLRNGILTYNTLDNTTTYWIHYQVFIPGYFLLEEAILGGYNEDTCRF